MKKLLLLFSAAIIFVSCNSNPDYEKNLATAVSFFELHGVEDLDAQLELVSKEIESESSRYGSEMVGYYQFVEMLKGYHDAFDNIKYTAQNWLPGTNEEGQLYGSVRTYGTWTGTNVITGKELDLKGYWYMNFDDQGKIVAQGDFFDFGGMFNAVYPKNLVFIQVKVKNGKKQEMIDLLNSERGIPTTVAYDGAIGYDMAYNDETNILHLIGNWESYEKYDKYLNWRLNEDDFIKQMVPLMVGGESGLVVSQPNSNYQSF